MLLIRHLLELPAGLAAVTVLVLLTDLVVLAPVVREPSLRSGLGLPLVSFLPGCGFTLVATGVAAVRRWGLPAEDRFRGPSRISHAADERDHPSPSPTALRARACVRTVESVVSPAAATATWVTSRPASRAAR